MDDQTEEGFRVEKSRDPRRVTRSTMDVAREAGLLGEAANQQRPASLLDEIVNRIHTATMRTSMLIDQVASLGERTFGPEMEVATEAQDKVKVCREGAVDRVFIGLGELDNFLSRLEAAQSRVNGIA
jgi:hypothetical protein